MNENEKGKSVRKKDEIGVSVERKSLNRLRIVKVLEKGREERV
jgi:hypothetical protein